MKLKSLSQYLERTEQHLATEHLSPLPGSPLGFHSWKELPAVLEMALPRPWGSVGRVTHCEDTGEEQRGPRTFMQAPGRVAKVSQGQGGAPPVPNPTQFPTGNGSCHKNSFSLLNQKTYFGTQDLQPWKDLLEESLHASPGQAGPPRARRCARPCFWPPTVSSC